MLTISASVITPIVFWASLVPWASETIEAEPIWPMRKPWGLQHRAHAAADPVQQPGAGARDQRRDDRRQSGRDDHLGEEVVPLDGDAAAAERVEPIRPPKRACDEQDGRPKAR